jgi:hypothetical protein
MPTGVCPLCQRKKHLACSHLIPRAVYDFVRTVDKSPFAISDIYQGYTDRQLQDYLLCNECEDVLNKGGETWLLPLLAEYDGPFPFHDLLTEIPPEIVDGNAAGFAAAKNPKIECDKLAHFALGVFWKASVHSWSGRKRTPLIGLGPYQEGIRRFLRQESAFPSDIVLTIGVLPAPTKLIAFEYPNGGRSGPTHKFEFMLPGIRFVLATGKSLSDELRRTCFMAHPARPIVLMDFSEGIYRNVARALTEGETRKRSRR